MFRKIGNYLGKCLPCFFKVRINLGGMYLTQPVVGIRGIGAVGESFNQGVKLGDREAASDVAKFLKDESVTLRREAAETFQELMARSATPHLIAALVEEDAYTRQAVEQALQGHLRAFFPYRTPDLGLLGLKPTSTLAERKELISTLEDWWKQQGR